MESSWDSWQSVSGIWSIFAFNMRNAMPPCDNSSPIFFFFEFWIVNFWSITCSRSPYKNLLGRWRKCETVQNGEYELKIEPEHCNYIYFIFVIGHYYVVKHLQSCQCITIIVCTVHVLPEDITIFTSRLFMQQKCMEKTTSISIRFYSWSLDFLIVSMIMEQGYSL